MERVFCTPRRHRIKRPTSAIRPDKSSEQDLYPQNESCSAGYSELYRNSMKEKKGKASTGRLKRWSFFEGLSILGIYASLGTDSEE